MTNLIIKITDDPDYECLEMDMHNEEYKKYQTDANFFSKVDLNKRIQAMKHLEAEFPTKRVYFNYENLTFTLFEGFRKEIVQSVYAKMQRVMNLLANDFDETATIFTMKNVVEPPIGIRIHNLCTDNTVLPYSSLQDFLICTAKVGTTYLIADIHHYS